MEFIVYPAIDLRAGRVVRLRQGDPSRETEYSDDPKETAQRWLSAGAGWLHVVNLDGAFGQASQENRRAMDAILAASAGLEHSGCIQLGGGLRERDDIEEALELGIRRVILGTLAVENPKLVVAVLEDFGSDRIVIGIDARDGQVLTRGWTKANTLRVLDFGAYLASLGIRTVIFTDVSRDGTGAGLNLFSARELAERTGLEVIASGGVDTLEDVRTAKEAGLGGVIVGRALYEERFSLEEALRC